MEENVKNEMHRFSITNSDNNLKLQIKNMLLETFADLTEFFILKMFKKSFKEAVKTSPVNYLGDGIEPEVIGESGLDQDYVYFYFKTALVEKLDTVYQ